jgi:hypothetical protein
MKFHSNIFGWEYVWEEFADEKGGTSIKDAPGNGGTTRLLGLEIPQPELEAVISVIPTNKGAMLKAGFLSADDFKLHLFVEHLIHRVEKVFGMPDIKVGDQRFDSRYVIHSNSQENITRIFAEASLRESILESGIAEIKLVHAGGSTQIHREAAAGESVLTCNIGTHLEKYEQLNAVYEVFVQLLTRLKQCGVVHDTTANVVVPPEPQTAQSPVPMRLHSPLLDR